MNTAIRPSHDGDVAEIAAIYRHHVLHGVASFEEIPPDEEEVARRRRDILELKLPYLVAERSGRLVGYCYASRYRTRSAYRLTLEDSIYVAAAEVGRGIVERTTAAAGLRRGLVKVDAIAGIGQLDGGCQTGDAGADDVDGFLHQMKA